MRVAVIPARGGSKRIPGKNIKEFCGKPIIAWSIEAAMSSGCFDKIIVSSDDNDILAVARQWGAETPFIRPAELSTDYVATIPVIKQSVEWLNANKIKPDLVCCLYATAPFVLGADIKSGMDLLLEKDGDYTFSVTSFPFPIQRAIRLAGDKRIGMFQPEHILSRSQDLVEAYHYAGQFYWGRSESWKQEKEVFSDRALGVVLPRSRVQDIDTKEDWLKAEWMFKAMQAESIL